MTKGSRGKRKRAMEEAQGKGEERRGIIGTIALAVAGTSLAAFIFVNSYTRDVDNKDVISEPNIEQHFRSAYERRDNVESVQSFIDEALRSRGVPLTVEVVYDPNFVRIKEFYDDQMSKYPQYREFIENLREGALKYKGNAEALTVYGLYGSKKIFIINISSLRNAEDLFWMLHHETCHAKTSINFKFIYGEAAGDAEEVRCFSYQFGAADSFGESDEFYNGMLVKFREFYSRWTRDSDMYSMTRDRLGENFVNPLELKYR